MWFVVGIGAFTILLTVEAWAITSGRLHKWPERYATTDAPLNVRHGFAVLWAGAISSALVTIAFVFIAVDRPGAAAAMILLIFASGYLWWRWPRRPPKWMKPPWLVAREEALRRGETPPPPEGVEDGQIVVGRAQYYGIWAVLTAATVVAVVFRQWSLLVGVAVGLPYAGLQRRRRVSRK
jgi:hypothetical protein